jgi:hypothetical protein
MTKCALVEAHAWSGVINFLTFLGVRVVAWLRCHVLSMTGMQLGANSSLTLLEGLYHIPHEIWESHDRPYATKFLGPHGCNQEGFGRILWIRVTVQSIIVVLGADHLLLLHQEEDPNDGRNWKGINKGGMMEEALHCPLEATISDI